MGCSRNHDVHWFRKMPPSTLAVKDASTAHVRIGASVPGDVTVNVTTRAPSTSMSSNLRVRDSDWPCKVRESPRHNHRELNMIWSLRKTRILYANAGKVERRRVRDGNNDQHSVSNTRESASFLSAVYNRFILLQHICRSNCCSKTEFNCDMADTVEARSTETSRRVAPMVLDTRLTVFCSSQTAAPLSKSTSKQMA